MRTKPIKAVVFLCLLSVVTGPATSRVRAVDTPSGKTTPAQQNARIVVVDRVAKTVTVELNGKLYLLKVGSQVKLTKNGKAVSINDLTAGQSVAVSTRTTATGGVEIFSVNVEPNGQRSEWTGKGPEKPTPPKPPKPPKPPRPPGHGEGGGGGGVSPHR